MTDSDQTKTKVTLKDSSGTSESAEIPTAPKASVSIPLVDAPPISPNGYIFFQKFPPGYIAELKSTVSLLYRRKLTLENEIKKIKFNSVRPAEIAFIKAQTHYFSSQNLTMQIEDLMNKYTETMRNASALRSICQSLEKKIINEQAKRADFIKESELLANTYDLSDTKTQAPHLNEPNKQGQAEYLDYQRMIQRLSTVQNALRDIQNEPNYELNTVSFNEVVKSAEMRSDLNLIGTKELNSEIKKLKLISNQNEDLVDMMMSENSKKRRKIDASSQQQYQKEQQLALKYQNTMKEYCDLSAKDNDKMELIRAKLDQSKSETQMLNNEIERIKSLPMPKKIEPVQEESKSESSSDSQEFYLLQTNQQLEITLNQQIFQMRCQINDLNQQYLLTKSQANERQNRYQLQIKDLYRRYNKNIDKIEKIKLEKRLAPTPTDFDNMSHITGLLGKITNSIENINTSFFGDTV